MSKYFIGEIDTFSALPYRDVISEIKRLQKRIAAFDNPYKAEIVISMLKRSQH